jgi:hypothetical protein
MHACMHTYIHHITSHHITLHYITYIHAYNQYNTQQTQSGHPETQQCIESMWESQKNRMLPKETWPKFMRHRSWPAENQHSQSVAGSSQPWVGKSRLLVSDRLSIYLPQGRRRAERRWKPFTAFPRKELCCQTAVLRNFLLESEMLTIYIYTVYILIVAQEFHSHPQAKASIQTSAAVLNWAWTIKQALCGWQGVQVQN